MADKVSEIRCHGGMILKYQLMNFTASPHTDVKFDMALLTLKKKRFRGVWHLVLEENVEDSEEFDT